MTDKNFLDIYKRLAAEPMYPDREFILSGQTYSKIYQMAAGIKKFFQKERKDFICLYTEKKSLITAALLASMNGGPSLLLPHSYNARVIQEMQVATAFNTVFTDKPEEIPPGLKIITPDNITETNSSPSILRDPDSIFLKLFTGGTTGKPKIWNKTPRNMLSEALYHSKAFNITKDDIFLSTVPPQHIYGLLYSILVPFVSSAKIIEQVYTFPREIISSIKKYSANIMISIPMHYRAFRQNKLNFPSLKLALSSGGNLDLPDALYFYTQAGVEVAEIFGSTETGGIAVRYNSGKEIPWRPFDNIDWKIEDERLAVRSEFISPDMPGEKNGFYVTEDRVEKSGETGFLHLGRLDGIIKIAGKRVDLREIENKLKQIAGIEDVIVISIPAAGARKNEIAALIKGSIDRDSVKKSAEKMLEPYSVPRKIKIINEMPLLSTGKYDRQKIEEILKS
jgi:acyl-coenzyme A synthetase/AMP-(fatty) acid ligase